MKFYQCHIGIAAALYSTIVYAADCTPLDAIGKITDIVKDEAKGSAFVVRAACPANERTAAYVYQRLYKGDRIEITGATQVYVSLAEKKELIFTRKTNHQSLFGKAVKDKDKSRDRWSGIIEYIFNTLDIIGRSRKPVPLVNIVRAPGLLRNDPLLPSISAFNFILYSFSEK